MVHRDSLARVEPGNHGALWLTEPSRHTVEVKIC